MDYFLANFPFQKKTLVISQMFPLEFHKDISAMSKTVRKIADMPKSAVKNRRFQHELIFFSSSSLKTKTSEV